MGPGCGCPGRGARHHRRPARRPRRPGHAERRRRRHRPRAHGLRRHPGRGAGGCRLGAGERARGPRHQAGPVARPRRPRRPRHHPRQLHLGHRPLALHRGPGRPGALPDLPPAQPALPDPRGRAGAIALDRGRHHGPRRGRHARPRPGPDRHAPRARRLRHEPDAGCAPGGGLPPGRRRLLHHRGHRHRPQGRPRPALVVHGPVRDHRPQRARRRARLRPALPADLRAPVPLDAAPRRLVGPGDRADRAGAPRQAARRRAWPTATAGATAG